MKFFKIGMAGLMTMGLFFTILPAALAMDNESVLQTIGHIDTDTATLSGAARNVTLTVPYSYAGDTVDLFNGLAPTYDDTLYKSVVTIPDSGAMIDGDAVALTVTYSLITDAEGTPKSQTVYNVLVVRAAPVVPTFSGNIVKTGVNRSVISFPTSDFTARYSQYDGAALGFVSISGSNLPVGRLVLSGYEYVFGTPINIDAMSDLSFIASASGTVSYDVKAYTTEDDTHPIGTAVLTVTVPSITPPTIQNTLTEHVNKGGSLLFSASYFTRLCNLNGGLLQSVEITPTNTTFGTWYLGRTAITGTTVIDASQTSTLSFSGKAVGTATFKWRVSNESGFSAYGTGSIDVSSLTLLVSSYTAPTSIIKGNTWAISASNFSSSTAAISYVKITTLPASADGSLSLSTALAQDSLLGYPAIAANKPLSTGAIIPYEYLSYLRLTTKSGSANSSVSFSWAATADRTISSSVTWSAPANYTVGFVGAGTVSFEIDLNIPVTLNSSDFNMKFYENTGYTLSYVTFTLPNNTSGILYNSYNISTGKGTKVSASAKYYTGANPKLADVTFVPTTDYTGTVSIPFKGYTADGAYASGTCNIIVSNSPGGTLSLVIDKNAPIQLDAGDFSSAFSNATGKPLAYVEFNLPSSYYGKLYYDYTSSSSYDSTVSSTKRYNVYSAPYLSYVTFLPYEDYTGTVTINYTGYTSGGGEYNGKLKIYVVDSPAGIVTYTTKVNDQLQLSADDFADEFIGVTGSVLSYLSFTPPAPSSGILYYNYSSDTGKGTKVAASTKYYSGLSPDISDITFVPVADYVGTVVIPFTAYTANGSSYAGKLKLIVGEASGGSLSYSTESNQPFTLNASDFGSKFYANTGGGALSYVMFTLPSSSYGKFYYNYTSSASYGSPVSASTKYSVNSTPNLSNITFVPYTGYSGSFVVTYTGYSADGTGYTGKIKITVGSDTVGSVNYRTNSGTSIAFRTADFSTAFKNETDKSLYYIQFTSLPSSSYGKLYYDYSSSFDYSTPVSYSTKYYTDSSPYLSSVSFVPNTSYTGVVTINYNAYDYDGNSYVGTVTITVGGSGGGSVNYETDNTTPVTLDTGDFINSFREETDSSLSYVTFTLPSSSYGKLYYHYTSSSSYDSAVSSSTSYYADSYPYLSNVTFVPNTSYLGPVSISYTAYNIYGNSYSGVLAINVKQSSAGGVVYETDRNTPLSLDSEDFNIAFLNETGASLNYVTFTLPSSSYGQLYFGYTSESSYSSKASASAKYYRTSSPLLSSVTFVPKTDYIGEVSIAYTGYTSSGKAYMGELKINVTDSQPFSDVGPNYSWASDAILYLYKHKIVAGTADKTFLPGDNVSRADLMLMVYRAFDLQVNTTDTFSDVAAGSYYYEAIATAKSLGIAMGNEGRFYPESDISRQDAMVIITRMLTTLGKAPQTGSTGDLSRFADTSDISDYALEAIAALVKAGVISGSNDGALHPQDSISRAEMALILYRILTM